MIRLAPIVLPALTLASCKVNDNQAFCANPVNAGLEGCPREDACGSNDDCNTAGLMVCDLNMNDGTCVQCTDTMHDACVGTTPACMSDVCRPCSAHSQCPSRACLIDGSCADAALVAYVRPGGSGTTCTDALPCTKVSDAVKVKSIVKVEGMITEDKPIVADGKPLQIVADPSSRLMRTGSGIILDVKNAGADVRVSDLEITGGMGIKTDATLSLSGAGNPKLTLSRVKVANNQGVGILATAGALRVTQSTISANAGGGISITAAQFEIVNNVVTGNGVATGGAATVLGGISLNNADLGTRRIEFNTIANNNAAMTLVAGVNCVLTQLATFSNNIVWDNTSGTGKLQIGGNCSWTYSDVGDPGTSTPPPGTGNLSMYPSFVNPGSNYHLNPDSPARNTVDPNATVTVDIDGDVRPLEGRSDMGADEFKPL